MQKLKQFIGVGLILSLCLSPINVFAKDNNTTQNETINETDEATIDEPDDINYSGVPADIKIILVEQAKFKEYSDQVALTGTMKGNADALAKACVENYEEYGVLPSVCIGQAYIESHIGVNHSKSDYNWWGIASCNIGYSTFNDGVIGYLSTINNGYYPNAPFNTDPYSTISAIAPNYATSPTYQQDVTWAINAYNLTAYDDYLFESNEYTEYLKSVKN